jgi:hypothetical protein
MTKIHRFIYLSSLGANESRYLIPQPMRFFLTRILLRIPLADHNSNENNIMKSKLQWTIVRPGSLTDGLLTGNLKHGTERTRMKGSASISRANVATFMIQQLTDTNYHQKAVWLSE